MSFTDINMYLVILLTMMAGIGITLFFVGALITVASAFGEGRKLWGIFCIIFLPISIVYCVKYWTSTQYPRKYLVFGLALIVLVALVLLLLKLF
ncbi:hypothetical protein [Glaciecola petra]|uniref:Uncharacterized protein n=1 Tax=Glaciecola petra TaxID=3075602 RepID=A0ABU2ZQT9_9ALTE|nr:hypothetical protein [Aestuariibacter sp. P117]MDT0595004.1 hypothetical protein [Aestuariibacter sp. P117]